MSSTGKVLTRTTWVLLLGVVLGALWAWKRDQPGALDPESPPQWPEFPSTTASEPASKPAPEPASAGESMSRSESDSEPGSNWVAPGSDGSCPAGYPVKAKESSGIYHVAGGRFYERTKPDRCYADPAAAAADGYRRSKS